MLTLETQVEVPREVLFRELDGEAVVLNLTTGVYFGLDEVATRMWEVVTTHGRLDASLAALEGLYNVERPRLERDFLKFIDDLIVRQLLAVAGESGPTAVV